MKKLILLAFVVQLMYANAQSPNGIDNDKAHRRYWYYRTRMINDFMKVGLLDGESIPFNERGYNETN